MSHRRPLIVESLESRLTPTISFGGGGSYDLGSNGNGVAAGDLNGDGFDDVVFSTAVTNLAVYLGSASGNLTQLSGGVIASDQRECVLVDINGDDKLDLVMAAGANQWLTVALGNGDGTFQTRMNFPVGGTALGLTVADFTGDGRPDVAVANGGVALFRNTGDASLFSTAVQLLPNSGNESVGSGDFNGDGKPDIATGVYVGNKVRVLLNTGNGTFAAPVEYGLNWHGARIVTGDFDHNGRDDIVVSYGNIGGFAVLLANADGTFAPAVEYAMNGSPSGFAVADFDLDGNLDLAVAGFQASRGFVFPGNGDGTLGTPIQASTGINPSDIAAGDFNGDGRLDLASSVTTSPASLTVTLNTSTVSIASFAVSAPASATFEQPVAVTVTARNAGGGTFAGFVGTVQLTSTDGAATFLSTVTFTAADQGVKTVTATFRSAGAQTVTATDPATGTTGTSATVLVAFGSFAVSVPSAALVGQPFAVTVTARNASGGTFANFTGTVHITSTDGAAVLPGDITFAPGDLGVRTVMVTLKTAGAWTVTATDTGSAAAGTSGSIATTQATATAALTSGGNPALPNAPVALTFTVTPTVPTNPRPTGLVQFRDNGVALGPPVALTGGATGPATATLLIDGSSVPFLAPGPHTITVQYAGDDIYQPLETALAALTQLVTTPSTTALTPQQGPMTFGSSASFLAAVVPQAGLPVPTGTVTFTNAAGAVLGTAALDATGHAVLSTATLPAGTVAVTATYAGDDFYRSSVGAATQVVDRQARTVVGSDAGPIATVQVFDPSTGALLRTINPFDQYTLGVKVATGDVNGDGVSDLVVSAGAGAPGGHVKVLDGVTFNEVASFFTFVGYTGGVNIAVGDIDGDGFGDVVVGTAIANDHVKAFSGKTLLATGNPDASTLQTFFAYSVPGQALNAVGVTVGTGDVDGDGVIDIITGSATFAGHVKAFSGRANGRQIGSYFAYGPGYLGGIYVAGGDLDGDGKAEIITGATNAPHVKALRLDGSEVASFFAYLNTDGTPPAFGVRVGAVDRNADRLADILTGSGGAAPALKAFSGLDPTVLLDSFIATPPGQRPSASGVFVGGSGLK